MQHPHDRSHQAANLDLQSFGFLVRYARAEWHSGPINNGEPPPFGPWVRTQNRAFLHLVLPTEAGIPKRRIEDFVLRLLRDEENLEVTVLADWEDYPASSELLSSHHPRKAEPKRPSLGPQVRRPEIFHSTVNKNAEDLPPAEITGRTTGRSKFAAT